MKVREPKPLTNFEAHKKIQDEKRNERAMRRSFEEKLDAVYFIKGKRK